MKKIATWVLAASLVLALTACGENGSNAGVSGEQNPTSAAQRAGVTSNVDAPASVAPELNDFEKLFADGPILAQGQNELWGYIDINGDWVIEPKYDYDKECKPFVQGLALALNLETGLWGFLGKNGEWAIEPAFSRLYEFSEEVAVAVDPETKKWGTIDKMGKWVIPPQFSFGISNFHEGRAVIVSDMDTASGKNTYAAGYVNMDGDIVIPCQYGTASLFSDGRALVTYDFNGENRSLWGPESLIYYLIDENGRNLNSLPMNFLPLIVESVETEHGGYFKWSYDYLIIGNYDFADKVYEHIGSYDYAYEHVNKLWSTGDMEDCESMVINKNGDIVFNGNMYNCNILQVLNDRGDLYVIQKGTGYYGVINISGDWILEPTSNHFSIRADYIDVVTGKEVNEYGVEISVSEKIEIPGIGGDNPPWDTSRRTNVGLAWASASVDGATKYGYKDAKSGEIVLDCIYDDLSPASDWSYLKAKYNGLWGLLDIEGNWLIEPQYLKMLTGNDR